MTLLAPELKRHSREGTQYSWSSVGEDAEPVTPHRSHLLVPNASVKSRFRLAVLGKDSDFDCDHSLVAKTFSEKSDLLVSQRVHLGPTDVNLHRSQHLRVDMV